LKKLLKGFLRAVCGDGGLAKLSAIRDVLNQEWMALRVVELIVPKSLRDWRRRRIFENIYTRRLWGSGQGGDGFFSGVGSRGHAVYRYAEVIGHEIEGIAKGLGRRVTVVDLGCGDFVVGSALIARVADIDYVGCDIVAAIVENHSAKYANERVTFRQVDIVKDALPDGDICLVRQVLQHLPNRDVTIILGKLSKYGAVYVSEGQPTVLEGEPNPDKPTGAGVRFDWRTGRGRGLEVDKPPFSMHVEEILSVSVSDLERIVTVKAAFS
jgi:hypothetical protein